MHLASGCQMLAGNEYLKTHNNALKVLIINGLRKWDCWKKGLCRYKLKWKHGTAIANDKAKLRWNFGYSIRKKTTACRPNVTIEYKDCKLIQIIDMACPVVKTSMRRLRRNYRSISNLPIRSGRGDLDIMPRSSQWLLDALEKVRISWERG